MYIMINDIKGEKRIDLSYPINSNKEIAVVRLFNNNFQYEVEKAFTFIPPNLPGNKN